MRNVMAYLQRLIVHYDLLHHRPAETAEEHARVLGLDPAQLLKTVVLDTHGGHALAVVPGPAKLDMPRVRAALGDPHAHLATEQEISHDYPEIELGAFPPLGPPTKTPVYVDPAVLEHGTVVFPAGKRTESIRMRAADLVGSESVTIIRLTAEPANSSRS